MSSDHDVPWWYPTKERAEIAALRAELDAARARIVELEAALGRIETLCDVSPVEVIYSGDVRAIMAAMRGKDGE